MHKIQEDQPGQTIISGHSDQIVDGGDEGAGCNGTMPPLHKWEWQACNDLVYSRKGHKNTIVGYKQNSYIAYNLIA